MRIYLIGMPGSGKSTVGKKLANKINFHNVANSFEEIFKT